MMAPNTSFTRAAGGGGSHFIDLAIDTYSPPTNALVTAETRAREYRAKHQKEIGRDTRYLAVQSYAILANEIPEMYAKLLYTPGVNSSDLEDLEANKDLDIFCVNIFDTKTKKLVDQPAYVVVDCPNSGAWVNSVTYMAKFIGRGG
jgi:hypothetical protein